MSSLDSAGLVLPHEVPGDRDPDHAAGAPLQKEQERSPLQPRWILCNFFLALGTWVKFPKGSLLNYLPHAIVQATLSQTPFQAPRQSQLFWSQGSYSSVSPKD